MPRHLISDAHERINESPTVPIYYLANRTIQERLRAFTNSLASDWDSPAILSMLELGINYSINPVTGVSPFTVTQGFLPLNPPTLSHPTPTVPHFQAYSPDQRLADMREH